MATASSGWRWLLDAFAVDNKSINKCKKIKQTHHPVHKLSNGLDVGPNPFAMGLWVNGASRRANDQATQTLLGVYFQKVQHPEQMLQGPPLWLELVANDELPKDLNDPHACLEELAEEPCLRRLRPNSTRCPVLDVPGDLCNIWKLIVGADQVDQ
jgi:hypothetical protein